MNGPSMPEDLVDRLQQLRARADAMPGAPDVFPVVAARKHRRRVIRRFQVASLILVVVASTAGTTYVLARAFGVGKSQPNVTPFIRHGPRPRNGLIAYVSKAEGTSDIWVVGPDGTGNRNLEALSTTDFGPAWSPDGRLIAFSQWGAGTRGISVMRADGSNVHRLTTGHSDYGAAWSPDGKRIAFARGKEIWVMKADGSNPYMLTRSTEGDREPSWSPDGTRIAFSRGKTGIWVIRPDNSGLHLVYASATSAQQPSWSPSGSLIAFQMDGNIVVVPADGGPPHSLTTGTSYLSVQPVWSPDGRFIVFERSIRGSGSTPGPKELDVMNADGSHVRSLHVTAGGASALAPSWQPVLRAT